MAIHGSFLGSVKVSGEEAKSFSKKLTHARGTKAASASADSGRKLAATFAKKGYVTIQLRKPKAAAQLKREAAKVIGATAPSP